MIRLIILTTLLTLTSFYSNAQKWAEMLHDGRANFYEIQQEFESTWSGMENERGSGWKPFKRWEYETEERVYPSGEFPPRHQLYTELQKFNSFKGRHVGSNERSQGSWDELGPLSWQNQSGWNPGIGRVNFIYEEPGNQNTIYVGTPAGGLWRSEDSGNSWIPLTDQLPSMGVSGIAVDPGNTDIIYIATGDRDANDYNGVGVLKSTDYGQTWQTTGMGWNISDGLKSNWLVMHPSDAQTLFLASNDGLYRTTDGAESWQSVLNGNIREVEFHPGNPDIVYAVSNRFYRSENGGTSFSATNDGFPSSSQINRLSLAVSAATPDNVYVLAGDEATSGYRGTYYSDNTGISFTEQSISPNIMGYSTDGSSSGGQSWFDIAIAASQTNPFRIVTGGINAWRSNNAGIDYNPKSHWVFPSSIGYTHADIHFLRYYGNRLYCGSDGGIFVSTDDGDSWTDLSEGIGNTQLYRMAFSESAPYNILVGTQDNGTNLLNNQNFTHLLGGDGNGAAINNDNPDVLYAAYPNGSITMSTDAGASFDGISGSIDENGLWVTPFVLDPSNQDVLYAGYQNIWKHTEQDGWEVLSSFVGGSFRALAVAPSNSNFIYAGRGSTLFRTSDGGASWDNVSADLPNLNITDIAVSANNPQHIIVTCSGYNSQNKVFESFSGGDTFENISFNLPNIPANAVVFENSPENGIYVGTDIGVFYTNDNLANWIDFMNGLPKTKVRQLLISESIGKIRAGTFGRGIWESDLYSPSDQPPVAGFSSNMQVVCAGDSVVFTDLSYNASPGWNWTFEGGSPSSSDERDPVVYFEEGGIYSVSLEVTNDNGSDTETQTEYIIVYGEGQTPPYSESFESFNDLFSNLWVSENPDDNVTWELNDNIGFDSSQSIWIDNMANISGQVDEITSPTIDLSGAGAATMTFKVAYAQRNELNNDRLRLYISHNCGETWTLRGQWKGTTNLPTAPATTAPFIPQTTDDWQFIEVSAITSTFFVSQFRFKFEWLNDNGNNVYIDDINLTMSGVGIDESVNDIGYFELYPNPARGQTTLHFELPESQKMNYSIMDATGRVVNENELGNLPNGEHRFVVHTYHLSSGMYFVKLQSGKSAEVRKLFIE